MSSYTENIPDAKAEPPKLLIQPKVILDKEVKIILTRLVTPTKTNLQNNLMSPKGQETFEDTENVATFSKKCIHCQETLETENWNKHIELCQEVSKYIDEEINACLICDVPFDSRVKVFQHINENHMDIISAGVQTSSPQKSIANLDPLALSPTNQDSTVADLQTNFFLPDHNFTPPPTPESTPEKAEVDIGSKNDANQKVKTSSIIEEENIMKRCENCRVWLDRNFDDHIKSCKPSNNLQINRYGYKCKICSFEVKRITEDHAR